MTTGTLINNFSDNVKELCCTISGIVKNKIVTPVSVLSNTYATTTITVIIKYALHSNICFFYL